MALRLEEHVKKNEHNLFLICDLKTIFGWVLKSFGNTEISSFSGKNIRKFSRLSVWIFFDVEAKPTYANTCETMSYRKEQLIYEQKYPTKISTVQNCRASQTFFAL